MAYNRNGYSGGRRDTRADFNFERDFNGTDEEGYSQRRRPVKRLRRPKPGGKKPQRSAQFRAGQAHERARLAGALEAPDTGYERDYGNGHGNGNGRGRSDREVNASRVRIGYRL